MNIGGKVMEKYHHVFPNVGIATVTPCLSKTALISQWALPFSP